MITNRCNSASVLFFFHTALKYKEKNMMLKVLYFTWPLEKNKPCKFQFCDVKKINSSDRLFCKMSVQPLALNFFFLLTMYPGRSIQRRNS